VGIFEYVSVLTSIIIGLGLTVLLRGISVLIQHPGRAKADWTHLLWALYVFQSLTWWWWFQFRLDGVEWTSTLYLFVILYAVVSYLLCAVLFPTDVEGYDGYQDYFMSRRGWFFSLLLLTTAIDVVDTALKGADYFASLGVEYPLAQSVTMGVYALGIYSASHRVHRAIVVVLLLYQVAWFLRDVGAGG
jgi:hypothetical protein